MCDSRENEVRDYDSWEKYERENPFSAIPQIAPVR